MTFSFNSRETYKTFRAEWKAAFNENMRESRDLKLKFREAARAVSALELTMARDSYGYLKPSSEWYSALSKVENLRSSRYAIREQANELLGELQAAKEEAHNQWLAAQQTSC